MHWLAFAPLQVIVQMFGPAEGPVAPAARKRFVLQVRDQVALQMLVSGQSFVTYLADVHFQLGVGQFVPVEMIHPRILLVAELTLEHVTRMYSLVAAESVHRRENFQTCRTLNDNPWVFFSADQGPHIAEDGVSYGILGINEIIFFDFVLHVDVVDFYFVHFGVSP